MLPRSDEHAQQRVRHDQKRDPQERHLAVARVPRVAEHSGLEKVAEWERGRVDALDGVADRADDQEHEQRAEDDATGVCVAAATRPDEHEERSAADQQQQRGELYEAYGAVEDPDGLAAGLRREQLRGQ